MTPRIEILPPPKDSETEMLLEVIREGRQQKLIKDLARQVKERMAYINREECSLRELCDGLGVGWGG